LTLFNFSAVYLIFSVPPISPFYIGQIEELLVLIFYRPRRRWVDNIRMDLKEIGWDGMDWIDLAQDRDQLRALVNMVMNLRVP
jgi:hypothetical protein